MIDEKVIIISNTIIELLIISMQVDVLLLCIMNE